MKCGLANSLSGDNHLCFSLCKYQLLEALFRALFALNQTWVSDEKWLARRVSGFEHVPERIEARIRSVIMHQGEDGDLENCLANLERLFADTVSCTHRRYPELDLPVEWG